MEFGNWKMGRGVGHLMANIITGQAADIETINKLRPWLEDEAGVKYGYTGKTKLLTDYDKDTDTYSFSLEFYES